MSESVDVCDRWSERKSERESESKRERRSKPQVVRMILRLTV